MRTAHQDRSEKKTLNPNRRFGIVLLLVGAIPVFTGCLSMGDEGDEDDSGDYGGSGHKPMTATHINK
jgi:hypothetical protein